MPRTWSDGDCVAWALTGLVGANQTTDTRTADVGVMTFSELESASDWTVDSCPNR